jgi:outer membrane protein assembly factor BamB
MFRHDILHSGASTAIAPGDNQVLWSYQTNFYVSSSPVVSHGRVYVGSWDWNLYCLEMDTGNLLWNYPTDGQITSTPAVANGNVYFGSEDNTLYCLDAISGTFIWSYKTKFIIESSPTVVDDKVFFGSSDGALYCLSADDGSLLWKYQTNSVIFSSPAVADGKVYVGLTFEKFLCLDSITGDLLWTFSMTDGTYSSPTVSDGKVYFGASDKNVYCLDATSGSLLWNYSAKSEVHSSPAVAYDSVYVGTSDGLLFCLDKNTGGFVWSYQVNGAVESSPAVADGNVYFCTDPCCGFTSYFICLNAFTGTLVWQYDFNTQLHTKSSPALAAGKVFACSGDGRVFAFGDVEFLADANGPYHSSVNVPVHFTGSVYGGQPGYAWYWEFGDSTTSTEQNPTHTYVSLGVYTVTLTITDGGGNIATDETSVFIEPPNASPLAPVITGPSIGRLGESYTFTFTTSDPNVDAVFYLIDWGDNTTSGWLGPFPSGAVMEQPHAWSQKGVYVIRAKAKDTHGAQGNWSDPFEVTMAVPELSIDLSGGIGLAVTIRNTGDAPATNVSWDVTLDGRFVFPAKKTGAIPTILPDGQSLLRLMIVGFGKTTITVDVSADDGIALVRSAHATLVVFFVIRVQ